MEIRCIHGQGFRRALDKFIIVMMAEYQLPENNSGSELLTSSSCGFSIGNWSVPIRIHQ